MKKNKSIKVKGVKNLDQSELKELHGGGGCSYIDDKHAFFCASFTITFENQTESLNFIFVD